MASLSGNTDRSFDLFGQLKTNPVKGVVGLQVAFPLSLAPVHLKGTFGRGVSFLITRASSAEVLASNDNILISYE